MSDLEKAANAVRKTLLAKQNREAKIEAMAIVRRFAEEEKTTITGLGHLSPAVVDELRAVHVTVQNKTNGGDCGCDPRESCRICEAPSREWAATISLQPYSAPRQWAKD